MDAIESAQATWEYQHETREINDQLNDEHLTERGLLVMQDWILLKEYDTHYHFMGLPSEVIIAWYGMGEPPLYNHPDISPHIINEAVAGAINGEEETDYTFMLCAAICEETDARRVQRGACNRSPDVKPSEAYDKLYREIRCVVSIEQEVDYED